MSIKAVIFDLGGVLVRTEDRAPRDRLAKRFGLDGLALEKLVFEDQDKRAQLGLVSAEQHWLAICDQLGLPEAESWALQQGFWGGDYLDTGLVEMLRGLRGKFRTGLLSNAFSDLRHYLTDVWKIADAFDEIIISAEVGIAKPDPRIYALALERLGVDAGEAVFVDDFIENIQAAQAAGLRGIHFRSAQQARRELQALLGETLLGGDEPARLVPTYPNEQEPS